MGTLKAKVGWLVTLCASLAAGCSQRERVIDPYANPRVIRVEVLTAEQITACDRLKHRKEGGVSESDKHILMNLLPGCSADWRTGAWTPRTQISWTQLIQLMGPPDYHDADGKWRYDCGRRGSFFCTLWVLVETGQVVAAGYSSAIQ